MNGAPDFLDAEIQRMLSDMPEEERKGFERTARFFFGDVLGIDLDDRA